ncbi:hypothetical protein GCM10023185_12680 [Hymenobacter saemangeumensis]|uniref:Outer membrane protein beta-barrel domain-containing protein n=1 Tax=Hymenobacter saemangeumensis TaxID=1084522 RepID=A0ABP8I7E2_9BACT
MRITSLVLPGMLLLGATTLSQGQAADSSRYPAPVPAETSSNRLLLKIGLNAGRLFPFGGYFGYAARLPLSVGAEYALSPRFTLYGQADADFAIPTYAGYFRQNAVLPTAGLGLGARYYYNQAGRARQNRAHGPFTGNYLAAEGRLETLSRGAPWSKGGDAALPPREYTPSLNLLWGMQRRLGHGFLLDMNAEVGLNLVPNTYSRTFTARQLNTSLLLNLGLYFGR